MTNTQGYYQSSKQESQLRLQPVNPKLPWAKGTCIAKVGPWSYLVESEKGRLYRRNRRFIRQDQSQEEPETLLEEKETLTECTPQTSPAFQLPQSLPVPAPPLSQSPEKSISTIPSTLCTRAAQDTTLAPTTRSGRSSIFPSKYKDYET